MDKYLEIKKINEIAEELTSVKEMLHNNIATKNEIYMIKLDECCNHLYRAILFDSLNLPSISSFSFFLQRLSDSDIFKYILQRLHECWMLVNYSTFLDSPLKEENIMNLHIGLSKYTTNKFNTDYNIVSEELNAPIDTTIAYTYYKKMMANKRITFYQAYLKDLYEAIKDYTYMDCYSIGKNFIPVCSLNVKLDASNLCELFKELASAGYMENNKKNKHSFLSLFSNTLHYSYTKIRWLDKNKKNNTPSIASLYTLFSTLEVKMTPRNRKIICSLFNDADDKPISVDQLKPRGSSANQRMITSIAMKYVKLHK